MVTKTLKTLSPKSPDLKYTGFEPEWLAQPDPERRTAWVIRSLNWYNYHYDKKLAKELLIDWLVRTDRTKDAKDFAKVPDSAISAQAGWLSRMQLRGLELTEKELDFLNSTIKQNLEAAKSVKDVVKEAVNVADTVQKMNIQDRLREKVYDCLGELEGMFDSMIADGAKMSASYKPMTCLRSMNVAPQMIKMVTEVWEQHLQEFNDVITGKDAQLVEGYSNFSKIQMRNLVKFAEQVIADCNSYVQLKKVERKPRKTKPVNPEKVAGKFKYLKNFNELKLASEPPSKLVGASEAWLYDTKKRKLIHIMSDSHVGSFTVKGSSIVGFDSVTTMQKTLRKPAEQLKSLFGSGLPAARKFFKDIKATETKFNGRGNENLIILRVK